MLKVIFSGILFLLYFDFITTKNMIKLYKNNYFLTVILEILPKEMSRKRDIFKSLSCIFASIQSKQYSNQMLVAELTLSGKICAKLNNGWALLHVRKSVLIWQRVITAIDIIWQESKKISKTAKFTLMSFGISRSMHYSKWL